MSSPFFTAFRRDRRSVHLSFACLLLLALASATWAASAPDPAGRVIRTLGLVEAIAPDGSVRRLRRQDPIFEGDTLRTGARGRAQIRFTDRGLMSLRPATELAIDDYEYDAGAPSSARQQLRLARGGFRAATGRVAAGNRAGYRVTTPLAVIGVRGTLWSAAQADGGPLALGVEEGGIEATTSTGRTATLGMDSGYDFARINVDGSIDYLVEPPAELASGSGIEAADDDEGGDGGGGSGAGGDAGTGGGSDVGGPVVPGAGLSVADSDGGDAGDEDGDAQSADDGSGQSTDDGVGQGARQVTVQRAGEGGGESADEGGDFGSSEDAGQAPAPAELGTAAASTALVTTTNSPENTGAIAQSESGTGSLATEEPIPGIDSDDIDARLQPAELEALADGFFFVGAFGTSEPGVAGGRAIDARTNGGATILTFNGVETPDGIEPVIPGDAGFLTLPPAFVLRNGGGVTDFVGTVGIPGGDSLAAVSWLADGGQTGSGSGSFGSGIDAFDAADGSPLGISFETAHFITGQPTAIADLTGSFDYSEASLLTSDFFANVAASSVPLTAVDFFFSVDFGTGLVSNGLLDLFTDGTQPVVSLVFDGRIVGEAGVNAADLNILDGIFGAQGSVDLERSELGGFFAGATGEAFAGVFSLFEAGGPGAALGTLAAQQAQPAPGAPGRPLTAAEQTRLEAGFGYAQATVNAGVARTFKGRITDPRDGDAAALVIANGGRTVLDPIFNDVPPNQVILRPDDALLQFLTVPTDDLGAELAFFEVQGFPDAPGLPGGPIGIYDSV
ncbi:MAG: FecR family protein, partial [Pseudomonadales bacterium]|nr:FecR family protein [Pseudomonadales bacterium]